MSNLYEGMFLIDNDLVRAGWSDAKAVVTNVLTKHGGAVRSARRWDERALAFPVGGRRRGTYVISYVELPSDAMPSLTRDLEITEGIMRYMIVRTDAMPESEQELATAEQSADFAVPPPPADDAGSYSPLQSSDDSDDDTDSDDSDDSEDDE
ncbi:MAG: 30S ribosomal protein S6 [Planctomycetota bacterium]